MANIVQIFCVHNCPQKSAMHVMLIDLEVAYTFCFDINNQLFLSLHFYHSLLSFCHFFLPKNAPTYHVIVAKASHTCASGVNA